MVGLATAYPATAPPSIVVETICSATTAPAAISAIIDDGQKVKNKSHVHGCFGPLASRCNGCHVKEPR